MLLPAARTAGVESTVQRMVPWTDDVLIFGGDHSLWCMWRGRLYKPAMLQQKYWFMSKVSDPLDWSF